MLPVAVRAASLVIGLLIRWAIARASQDRADAADRQAAAWAKLPPTYDAGNMTRIGTDPKRMSEDMVMKYLDMAMAGQRARNAGSIEGMMR